MFMRYYDMNKILMTKFPELLYLYEKQFVFWGDDAPPQHCFFGAVLNEYLSTLLYENTDQQMISRIFAFYEEMALSDDIEIRNMLQVTLLEYLWDDFVVFTNAMVYMLPETKRINEMIGEYLKKPAQQLLIN